VEEAWIGVTARSWRDRRVDAGWEPDGANEYCPRCGSSAGPYEADGAGCSACRGKRLAWERCVRLGSYEGVLREAILSGKYTGWRRVCQDLGADLGHALAAALREAQIPAESIVICPVATSRRRRMARGVDHTAVLARELARATGGSVERALRRRHRPPQQGLSIEARRENVRGAFVARMGVCSQLNGRLVVLVDDVRTTGATLSAAGRALREGIRRAGGREQAVWTAVLAVASRR
jgi:ComF family protein